MKPLATALVSSTLVFALVLIAWAIGSLLGLFNTADGVANCDQRLVEVGRVLGLGPWARIRRIILPAALPSILVGLRLGLGFSWRSLIGAELLAAAAGLGYMIIEAEQFCRPDIVMVGIVVIGCWGLVLDGLFAAITGRLLPWYRSKANGRH